MNQGNREVPEKFRQARRRYQCQTNGRIRCEACCHDHARLIAALIIVAALARAGLAFYICPHRRLRHRTDGSCYSRKVDRGASL